MKSLCSCSSVVPSLGLNAHILRALNSPASGILLMVSNLYEFHSFCDSMWF